MTADRRQRPSSDEFAAFYESYIAAVPDGDIVETLAGEMEITAALLERQPRERADFRYAPGKWTVKEVVGHVLDAERVFGYRALRFARGDGTPLPGFDENQWAAHAPHAGRPLVDLIEELRLVRAAHVLMFRALEPTAWGRSGEANRHRVTVRALAWMMVGHELHHRGVLTERYGVV